MSAASRILLADDHLIVRDALRATIRRCLPSAEVSEAHTAEGVQAAVARESWDLVVLDLGLPGGGELEVLRALRAVRPAMPILVFSMFTEVKMGCAALEAGADGYLCKTADRVVIRTAITEMLAGRGYVTASLRALQAKRPASGGGEVAKLSTRELEVLLALGRGESSKEVAARLGLGASSVGTYRARLLEKLGLRTTADLQRYVVEHRLTRG